jgi:phage gp45-like
MIRDILNRITSLIKRSYVTLVGNDNDNFQTTQVTYLSKTANIEVIYPYGVCGNPPLGSLALTFNVQGQEENRAGIFNLPNQRFKGLKAGEVAIGNYLTGSVVKFLENGNIEVTGVNDEIVAITSNMQVTIGGSATVNITGTATVNCPTTTINGDVNINGNLNVTGDSTSTGNTTIDGTLAATGLISSDTEVSAQTIDLTTHTHSGVTPGGGSTGSPNP